MAKLTTKELTELFPECKGAAHMPLDIDEVVTDSRSNTHFGLFVPIVGERFDGHEFLKDAIKNGAIASLWQKDRDIPEFVPTDFPLFFVEDTLKGLQDLAKYYRKKVDPVVIGITGSNGKTTTKDLFAEIFKIRFKTHKTSGNFNNHIGLPLTILKMDIDTEVLIVEMGMNHFGEIMVLSEIARPDVGVITNIGESHIEYLGSREGIAQAKSELLAGLKDDGILIIDGDEPLLEKLRERWKTITVGFDEDNDYVVENVQIEEDRTTFTMKNQEYSIPLPGGHQAKNAGYAIAAAERYEISSAAIQTALQKLEVTGMRFQKIVAQNGATIINDAYNASPTSMKASIEVVKQLSAERKVLVLGDMFELGEWSESFHRSIGKLIEPPISAVYTTGDASKWIVESIKDRGMPVQAYHIQNPDELSQKLKKELQKGTLLFFKASRGMKLEKVIEKLI
ncbi:UDP-N-acetylmuramoyl-tripeptide--D-alanyl-D-alanine ligase [Melghiribacillus thermohalophilus]|uniref:UDP-N-acetylmuramoyl-tripeptide--D-alanyl-D-alanine ligase n=1 Tax=Melghiribacillus thermohalophilus TaxID=1324956 RepID=A0A4R3NHV8_9BACI|nr:UDP-N-acetylmuramoyl-tripeptide--D-alanyl-D-alanine ligase [Melghiribacillus thermohalophilus]TCT26872.1 UDP-N-acetylmuramoyl-tripeptide--D-alanyl-D-alanine ligase [Melghiribacillus thermohalophilus]